MANREHEWVAIIPYNLDNFQARLAMTGKLKVILNPSMVRWDDVPPVGCYNCEQTWEEGKDKPCPGQPPGRLEYV